MKYYVIAGEASGDLHGSGLMKAISRLDIDADFRFWGGDMMQEAGGTLVRHISQSSFMGFWEVFRNLGPILASIWFCRKDLKAYRPDALILIDYPGFNLRMARYAKKIGIRVFYYISPKVWAWNQSRIISIKRYVDHMLTIFPFETEFYRKFGYRVDYVGNPLLDVIENRHYREEDFNEFRNRNGLPDKPVISILAGSRIQEIENCLPVMLSVIEQYPEYQFVIAGAPSVNRNVYLKHTRGRVPLVFNQTYACLQQSVAAVVVSGTATLETALLGIPQVVCYRGSYISYQIAKRFIKVKFISLVNLIMEREVVRELIQDNFNSTSLREELDKLLSDHLYREKLVAGMSELRNRIGEPGATERAARKIFEYLNGSSNQQN